MIPITVVDVKDSEELVLQVLRSGNLAQGPLVAQLEKEFAALHEVEHAVAVNNGTTALVAAIESLHLGPEDEVITSPFTFVATLNAVLEAGAVVRFADISEEDFCVTASSLSEHCNSNTRVLLPVDLYGQTANMLEISSLAQSKGLRIVEDAAQAHGASIANRMAGSFDIGTFSLYATKNITSGEGGIITTNDSSIADYLRILRNQGMRERYNYVIPGHNYRMTDLQAAIAIPQISKVNAIADKRASNARKLQEGLANLEGVKLPKQMVERRHVWHQFTIILNDDARIDRDAFIEKMALSGIGCGSYYPKLVFEYDCFRSNPRIKIDNYPVADRISKQCVSLPVHQYLSDSDVDKIISVVRSLLQ
jgi:dTDP-4-amino-4,6-dideoxygalactose transaminase